MDGNELMNDLVSVAVEGVGFALLESGWKFGVFVSDHAAELPFVSVLERPADGAAVNGRYLGRLDPNGLPEVALRGKRQDCTSGPETVKKISS